MHVGLQAWLMPGKAPRDHAHVVAIAQASAYVIGGIDRASANSKTMEKMERSKLDIQLRNLEREAQNALTDDVSFLEALQGLKWEVDSDARVKAATQALRNRGLMVCSSFAPRIRIALHAGEDVFALPKHSPAENLPDAEDADHAREIVSGAATQELRDAATAVVSASLYCRQLDGIIGEALHATAGFERIAAKLERAGYQLHICLDLSTYARVYEARSEGLTSPEDKQSLNERQRSRSRSSSLSPRDRWQLPLSGQDIEFLRKLNITT